MEDTAEAGRAFKGIYKASIEAVCTAVDLYARASGDSQAIADVMLFEMAKELKMKPEGRAAKFVDHFLYGGGEDIVFGAGTLLNEDLGVRKRVSEGILEKIRNNPSLLKADKRMSGGEYVISIRQRDYANSDWRNALGSFAIEWEFAALSLDRNRMFATVWGANEYKWHPAADRVTQCIHQAGDRLTRSKKVKATNFWMKAMPAVIVISTGKPVTP